jgi:tetratricopeptide (TPR) repeat protein
MATAALTWRSKSQLAIHHAYRAYEATPRPYVFWVHASTRARFEEAYRGIAERLELPRRHDPKADVLRLVSDWLHDEANGRWTMVLDNVDDVETFFLSRKRQRYERNKMLPASLAAYIPQSRNGSILITSRSKDAAARLAGGYQNIKEVLVMDVDQGIQLLWNKLQPTSTEEGASADLVRELDCMPLAISQAAAYINRRGRMTTAGYLYEFHANSKKKESLLNWDAGDLRRDESASNSVVTTWQMSFERVRQERPSAADLLSLMSFFNPQGIPEWTLRSHSKSVAEVDNNDDADRAFNEDIDLLQAYSLVAATAKSKAWEMHALVQYCTQVWLSSFGVAELWERKFVELMGQEFPTGIFENWGKCQELLPHCGVLYEAELSDGESVKKWAGMLNHIARYIQTVLGRYSEAEKLDRLALQKSEKALGKQHLSTLTCMNGLALVLKDQGKYGEAEILHRRALEGYEKELGEQHPDTLASVNNLASVLYAQGKYSEAEALIRWALEKHVKELGEQHPSSLTSMNNLASVLQAQEKYSEAETLGRRALERREKKLGEQHPDTLTSVNNLSAVLRAQGKYSEAETLSRRALEGYEKELGKQHPATLIVMGNLAKVLQQSGELCEAEILTRRVLEYFEKELGEQHPHTLTSVNNMALVLQDQKKYSEAETLIRRALEGRKKKLGEQHPSTLMSLNNLASVLQAQGKYSDAETLSRRGL